MRQYKSRSQLEGIFLQIIESQNLAPKADTGRPRSNILLIFRGLFEMLVKGLTWREFNRQYGTRSTAHRYFTKWSKNKVFQELWRIIAEMIFDNGDYSFNTLIIDGSDKPVKNMLHKHTSIGYKHKSKNAVKLTILATPNGIPIALDLSDAGQNDSKRFGSTLNNMIINNEDSAPRLILADKGYYGEPCKKIASEHNFYLLTPFKTNSKSTQSDTAVKLLKIRHNIENLFARLYQFARIDRILDKTINSYKGWCELALSTISVSFV